MSSKFEYLNGFLYGPHEYFLQVVKERIAENSPASPWWSNLLEVYRNIRIGNQLHKAEAITVTAYSSIYLVDKLRRPLLPSSVLAYLVMLLGHKPKLNTAQAILLSSDYLRANGFPLMHLADPYSFAGEVGFVISQ